MSNRLYGGGRTYADSEHVFGSGYVGVSHATIEPDSTRTDHHEQLWAEENR